MAYLQNEVRYMIVTKERVAACCIGHRALTMTPALEQKVREVCEKMICEENVEVFFLAAKATLIAYAMPKYQSYGKSTPISSGSLSAQNSRRSMRTTGTICWSVMKILIILRKRKMREGRSIWSEIIT